MTDDVQPDFVRAVGRVLNSGQARTVLLTGNVHDLFFVRDMPGAAAGRWLPLVDYLVASWRGTGRILVVYELNGPLRFADDGARARLRDAWVRWRTGRSPEDHAIARMLELRRAGAIPPRETEAEAFDARIAAAPGSPTLALELLRQLCQCSRSQDDGKPSLADDLLVIIEGADWLLPDAPVAQLADADRRRIAICRDWFSDPGFLDAGDAVVLVAESRSQLASSIVRLPQLVAVEIPAPDTVERARFLAWLEATLPEGAHLETYAPRAEVAEATAGLSLHAIAQLAKASVHTRRPLAAGDIVRAVEDFLERQLGEGVVEVTRPAHRLADVVGNRRLKAFLSEEMIPRLRMGGSAALAGAAIAGPIGSGKTFIFEAVAGELGVPVLVLKTLRSQWFGQTDVIFERLRRTLLALAKVIVIVDEADTQLGGVGEGVHETERRLTGKIQAMMSDSRLRGRVVWLLMTARIHRLSPDLRRPGRVGDLIVPVLDPEGDDRRDFLRFALRGVLVSEPDDDALASLDAATLGWSAAAFAALRGTLQARVALRGAPLTVTDALAIVSDTLPAAIDDTRRYQTLQALLNCTRRSLLPDPDATEQDRRAWAEELRGLEVRGIG
jgi:SpoVK/Ycf46/Vps4 family AAA+-type ATPase